MSDLVMAVATRNWDGWFDCAMSWAKTCAYPLKFYVVSGRDVVSAYQEAYEKTAQPIIGMVHDDVVIYEEGWCSRVLREFADPGVGLVGFGGAIGHGQPNLYRVPYSLPNLARQNFMSNLRHAEVHGERFTGERDVAVLDGFALFVRRKILDKVGGWPVDKPYGYFMYSEWLCCEVRRQGYRIRLVGVDCDHLGGKSSGYIPATENYEEAHRYFFENNRDVMPWRVED